MKYLDKVKGFLDDTEAKKLSSLIDKTSSLGPALGPKEEVLSLIHI